MPMNFLVAMGASAAGKTISDAEVPGWTPVGLDADHAAALPLDALLRGLARDALPHVSFSP